MAGGSNMKRTFSTQMMMAGLVAAATLFGACTMKSQEAPPLTGPSEFGTSIIVSVTPDTIFQDGSSQSLVTVTARDQNGNPLRNVSLRAEIFVDFVAADFGSLSARSIVTGADGRATLVYTAPSSPPGPSVDNQTTVNIAVTPLGNDFGNAVTRFATIRLVPTGVVVPPDGLQPKFTFAPTTPTDNQSVLFDASTSVAPANNPIATYSWNFGDGQTGSGRTTTHSFSAPGNYAVTLTITDAFKRTAVTTQSVVVSPGTGPTGGFLISPSAPRVGQAVNFDAAGVRPAPGRTIRSYAWSFGDGDTKTVTSPQTTHDYQAAGTYSVTLVTTDDAGRTALASGSVTVLSDSPTADFTFSQVPPTSNHTIQFSSSNSSAISGRTITTYFWEFGDGTTSTSASPSHSYPAAASYNVTLTVTDSGGATGRVTKTVSVL